MSGRPTHGRLSHLLAHGLCLHQAGKLSVFNIYYLVYHIKINVVMSV